MAEFDFAQAERDAERYLAASKDKGMDKTRLLYSGMLFLFAGKTSRAKKVFRQAVPLLKEEVKHKEATHTEGFERYLHLLYTTLGLYMAEGYKEAKAYAAYETDMIDRWLDEEISCLEDIFGIRPNSRVEESRKGSLEGKIERRTEERMKERTDGRVEGKVEGRIERRTDGTVLEKSINSINELSRIKAIVPLCGLTYLGGKHAKCRRITSILEEVEPFIIKSPAFKEFIATRHYNLRFAYRALLMKSREDFYSVLKSYLKTALKLEKKQIYHRGYPVPDIELSVCRDIAGRVITGLGETKDEMERDILKDLRFFVPEPVLKGEWCCCSPNKRHA